jgi:hypothetical protein
MVSRIGARRRLRHRKLAFPTEAVGPVAFADPIVAAPRARRATARAGATQPRPKAHEQPTPTPAGVVFAHVLFSGSPQFLVPCRTLRSPPGLPLDGYAIIRCLVFPSTEWEAQCAPRSGS